ncbi:MAG TPA: hypothetical protein VM029_21145 [Opitutaceae bacterium]|nr:hypothetical protein [Opitutaceae bacterium]
MGFFDRFTSKKPEQPSPPPATVPAAEGTPTASAPLTPGGGVKPRLEAAREKLEAKDLAGAIAIYEEVLAVAGDRADVLVAISGELGAHGHVSEIVELIAPRFDVDRHGPATGLNLLQAYLAVRNTDAAQHLLDILFSLNRPELEDRLHGFSNAIAELLVSPGPDPTEPGAGAAGRPDIPQVALINISKPIWFYGLEPMAAQILPPKEGRLRRIAFAQLALPGHPDVVTAMQKPEDELARLSRAIPAWFAETFYFSAAYAPGLVVGVLKSAQGAGQHVIFNSEWTTDNLRQLADTAGEALDYIVTGSLKALSGDYELGLRIWEVKNFRERKTFTARWTPATADVALLQVHAQVRAYMEWSPASAAFAYTMPVQPRTWLETLGAAVALFLVEKSIVPPELLAPVLPDLQAAASRAAASEAASLAFLTFRARAKQLKLAEPPGEVALARSPLVAQAAKLLG